MHDGDDDADHSDDGVSGRDSGDDDPHQAYRNHCYHHHHHYHQHGFFASMISLTRHNDGFDYQKLRPRSIPAQNRVNL